jgi:hypothetical protein
MQRADTTSKLQFGFESGYSLYFSVQTNQLYAERPMRYSQSLNTSLVLPTFAIRFFCHP